MPSLLKTPEPLRSYALYSSFSRNGIVGSIAKREIAGHGSRVQRYTKHLEAHHCSHEGRVTRCVIEQDSGSPVTSKDNDVKPKPFTAVDRLNFKDSSSQVRSIEDGYIFIFREVCQIVFEVIIPVGEFPVLETAENVHSLGELIVESYAEYIFTTSTIEA